MGLERDIFSIDRERMPKHIAIIMDGNGRWAKERNLPRVDGHSKGVETVQRIVEASGRIGLQYLTLYTFSTENWNRPKEEVDALMALMLKAIEEKREELIEKGVRIRILGNREELPESVREKFNELELASLRNEGLTLSLAVNYGARSEILDAVRRVAKDYKAGIIEATDEIDGTLFERYLTTAGMPDPDLLIRTGGECRLSNFLLWQSAYTEFYFVEKYWPDFEEGDLYSAIFDFATRERRFGKTGEQVEK